MKNEYKPGQLITAYGHIYRIVKRPTYPKTIIRNGKSTTIEIKEICHIGCALRSRFSICFKYCYHDVYNRCIPEDCYFRLVK